MCGDFLAELATFRPKEGDKIVSFFNIALGIRFQNWQRLNDVAGFLDLPGMIEKIYLSLRFMMNNYQRNGKNIKCHIGKEFAQVSSARWFKAIV